MSTNKQTIFTGAATALITPFNNGTIDFPAFERLIDRQLADGIDALVIAGTTGEAPTLSYGEHSALVGFAVRQVRGRVPVIAGCGSNCTANAVRLATSAHSAGADALLVVTPYYNKATPDGIIRHYTAITDAVPLPLILYNVPSRTGVNLSPGLCGRLSEIRSIVAIKEASGNICACADIIAACGDALRLYSGNDDITLPVLSLGGCGVISVLSNLIPGEVVSLCKSYRSGLLLEAASSQLRYMELIDALFSHVNPIPVKTALAALGLCREEFRLPLCPLSDNERSVLLSAVMKYVSI